MTLPWKPTRFLGSSRKSADFSLNRSSERESSLLNKSRSCVVLLIALFDDGVCDYVIVNPWQRPSRRSQCDSSTAVLREKAAQESIKLGGRGYEQPIIDMSKPATQLSDRY